MTPVTLKLEVPGGADARVLLHSCCAPCSGAIIETMVAQGIRPTIFWSNSNIYDKAEYDKRRAEILRYADKFGLEVVDDDFDHASWLAEVAAGREEAPERGARCLECFRYRLLRAARYAATHGFSVLTTTLASSRWKSLEQVDAAGAWACESVGGRWEHSGANSVAALGSVATSRRPGYIRGGAPNNATEGSPDRQAVAWWGQNWRICGLQPRRSEIIREQNFYNQSFCGCEFSLRQTK